MTARNWLEQRCIFILMIRRHPKATLTSALVPYTTRSRTHGSDGAPPRWRCTAAFGESWLVLLYALDVAPTDAELVADRCWRSEEHTSELQSLMRISYAVFCLKKKNEHNTLNFVAEKLEQTMHTP